MDSAAEALILAKLAGLSISGNREAALAAGLEGMRRIAEALARHHYGEAEPAAQFRPPRGTDQ